MSYNGWFQSLTRDSNHSNALDGAVDERVKGFNPSRGIAIIQTRAAYRVSRQSIVSIPHAG